MITVNEPWEEPYDDLPPEMVCEEEILPLDPSFETILIEENEALRRKFADIKERLITVCRRLDILRGNLQSLVYTLEDEDE